MGGIGKTQIACEFVFRYGRYFEGGVYWLSFADPGAVRAEIAACRGAASQHLPPNFSALPLDDQLYYVLSAWQSPLPRLLVFDNCEEEALIDNWRPPAGGCRVLVTSRRHEWDHSLGVIAVSLGVLNRQESIALLCEFRPDLPAGDPDLNTIAEELGDLPLALHLAGSSLHRYRYSISPSTYLSNLRSPQLLNHRSLTGEGLSISPTRHDLHVGRTFALSYDRLDPTDPTDDLALKLLARAAHFAPGEPIPRELLVRTLNLPEVASATTPQAEDPLRTDDALTRLSSLGLLEVEAEGALRLHRLLAIFTRSASSDQQAQSAVEQILVDVAFDLNQAGIPGPLLALQPHLRYVTDLTQEREDELAAALYANLGYHLQHIGDYKGARPLYERALAISEKVHGPDHPSTARSLNNLAELLRAQGDYEGARPLFERALAIREKVLGSDHPDTATSLNNLSSLLYSQGDYGGARPLFERALAVREKALGPDHPYTAISLNNLALLLKITGGLRKCASSV